MTRFFSQIVLDRVGGVLEPVARASNGAV